jgi:predicted HD phosphohydrolase
MTIVKPGIALTSAHAIASDPLDRPEWRYVDHPTLEGFTAADWRLMNTQRAAFYAEHQADETLRMLAASARDTTFGYRLNNYHHCLQAATLAMQDGCDEETIVAAVLHDIGFIACPDWHGAFAASLLGAYVGERTHWMLVHHMFFQQIHIHDYPGLDPNERERWRGHPHFEWTAQFVARYDQNAIQPDLPTAPLEVFAPMVRRVFARPPRRQPTD